MVWFASSCQGCGRVIAVGSWCASCADDEDAPQRPAVEGHERRDNPGGHWSPGRDVREQKRFRANLVRRYGERCMAVGPTNAECWWRMRFLNEDDPPFSDLAAGTRCDVTTGLQAHHGKDGMPDMLLCRMHHCAVDRYAR